MGALLWSLVCRDFDAVKAGLTKGRAELMAPLSAASMESYSRAYPLLLKLHMLQEVADMTTLLQVRHLGHLCQVAHGFVAPIALLSIILSISCLNAARGNIRRA